MRFCAALCVLACAFLGCASARAQTPAPTPGAGPVTTPALPQPVRLAPFKERLAAAKSTKAKTSVLGIELGASLRSVHKKLDPLTDPAQPPKEEGGGEKDGGSEAEGGRKVLWQFPKGDYSSLYVKTDEKERVTYILASLRPGKEIPFEKIGDLEKAPIHTDAIVAWDVIRPGLPFTRVVGQGEHEHARSLTIFIVERPRH